MLKSFFNILFPNLTSDNIGYYICWGILIWILIFLLLREIKCWYYKINERIEILHSIDNRLKELNENISMIKGQGIQQQIENSISTFDTNTKVNVEDEMSKKEDFTNEKTKWIIKFKEFMTKKRYLSDFLSNKENKSRDIR